MNTYEGFVIEATWLNDGTADLDVYCERAGCDRFEPIFTADHASTPLPALLSTLAEHDEAFHRP